MSRHDPAELARSLLAEMPFSERAQFLTDQLVASNHPATLPALIEARNALTAHIAEMLDDQWERENL